MSKLIHMRHRIKAIETIKKITHAMRLISMSTHSRLKHQEEFLTTYNQTVTNLFAQVYAATPKWTHNLITPSDTKACLVVLVGSQKGLCGNFNTNLFKFFTDKLEDEKFSKISAVVAAMAQGPADRPMTMIGVGRKAVDFLHQLQGVEPLANYPEFNSRTLTTVAHAITSAITQAEQPYSSVLIVGNILKGFFTQKPTIHQLIPFEIPEDESTRKIPDYAWEQTPQELLDELLIWYIESRVQHALFQSLLAEHAARFISMDSATRNAENLLEAGKLEYNKARQAKITSELTELVGGFQVGWEAVNIPVISQ